MTFIVNVLLVCIFLYCETVLGCDQPRSQGLSSYRLGGKMRDPGNEVGL